MRAPLLLHLLLLCVSSQEVITVTSATPGENGPNTAIDTSKMSTTTSNPGNPTSASATTSAAAQDTNTTKKPGNPLPAPVIPPTTAQGNSTTSSPGNPPSTSTLSAAVQGTNIITTQGNPSPDPMTLSHPSQQIRTTTISGTSTATSAVTPSVAQQKTPPTASLGNSLATTVSPVPTHGRVPPVTKAGLSTAVTPSPTMGAQGKQPLNQLTSTTVTTGVPTSSLGPRIKDHGVSSPTAFSKQPHSTPSSPGQGLTSSTRPGSIKTSVTPFEGSVSPTTSKASASLSPGSIHKVSEATTPTLAADQRRPATVSTKSTSTDQSPASAQPSAPALGDQTASSSPGHQHPTLGTSFQNKLICEIQGQNNRPMIYLKEAKTCADWRTASSNISFFESFCSTGQYAFNASRETCWVRLTSHEPHSQHWEVQALVHFPLDPEKVLKELKEKDKLEELGIANITYDKMEREMVITDEFSTPLIITIVTLAGSLLLIAAIYGCCHQRFSQKKDQHIHPDLPGFDDGHVALIFNRLTEELQTMENGYHDNPTLEVMETSSEMQEKKVNLNGELGDSWIVPLDTLMKEDLEEEEDTHL